MSAESNTADWSRLAPPPRRLTPAVQSFVRTSEFKQTFDTDSVDGYFAIWCVFAAVMGLGGTVVMLSVEDIPRAYAAIPLAAAIALGAGVAAVPWFRSRKKLEFLREGRVLQATIAKIWSQDRMGYSPLADDKWARQLAEYREKLPEGGAARIRGPMVGMMRNYSCKLDVQDGDGGTHEAKALVDIRGLACKAGLDPNLQVFVNPRKPGYALVTRDLPAELRVSSAGELTVEGSGAVPDWRFAAALVRRLLPVMGSYAMAALGLALFAGPIEVHMDSPQSPWLRAAMVFVFTLTNVVMATLLFRAILDGVDQARKVIQPGPAGAFPRLFVHAFNTCIWFFIILWFSLPIGALAWLTGGLSVAWAAGHVALAGPERRAWIFIEYGSTSLALLLFVVCFSDAALFPWGLAACLAQALVLAALDLAVGRRWLPKQASASAEDVRQNLSVDKHRGLPRNITS